MPRFGSNATTRPARREEYGSQHQEPTAGHAEGVPEFPAPLPGSHHYAAKEPVTVEHQLDVGPAGTYYGKGGMAHGVPSPPQHGGRPAPRPGAERGHLAAVPMLEQDERARHDPVPVYVVSEGAGAAPLLRAALRLVPVQPPGADPIVLVPRNIKRRSVRLLNEGTSPVRITADLTGSGGSLLPASMTSYLEIDTQDEVCAYVPASVAGLVTAAAAFVATGNGTATLPAGASLTRVDVTVATAAAANTLSVTITGGLGGTLTYSLASNGNAQLPLQIPLPAPLTPANPATGIAVTVTGAAGTPAGNIVAYGTGTTAPTSGTLVSVIEQYDVPSGG